MPHAEILNKVAAYAPHYVTVTGGEPLAQPGCLQLLQQLCDQGYQVSIETSGAVDVRDIDQRVSIVLDLKTPGSGEVDRNLYDNLKRLNKKDQVKFVICDRHDYEWARDLLREKAIDEICEVLFSPEHKNMAADQLADWLLADHLPVRMQIQLHKYLWGDVPGR